MACALCGDGSWDGEGFCPRCRELLRGEGDGADLRRVGGAGGKAAADADAPIYAGFWRRAAAALIDTLLLELGSEIVTPLLVAAIAAAVGAGDASADPDKMVMIEAVEEVLAWVVIGVLTWLYFPFLESSQRQATFGKQVLGLRVTDENFERIGFRQANRRYLYKALSALILGIGFLMAGFTAKKQALHDKMAHTLVVRA